MEVTLRPLGQWPRSKNTSPRRSRFRVNYQETKELLCAEVRKQGARDVVVRLDVSEDDIRDDGLLRAASRPGYHGVIVHFEGKYGPIEMPCDKFDSWTENLRAIALTLHRLRLADLYGVTTKGEQYAGWKALPGPTANFKTLEQAVSWAIQEAKSLGYDGLEIWDNIYRFLVKKFHPDTGGDAEKFHKLQEAKEIFERVKEKIRG